MRTAGMRGGIVLGAVGATLIAVAALAAISAVSVRANAFADACGVISEFELAKILGQPDVVVHSSPLREPGNSAGVLRVRCREIAFAGSHPPGASQERRVIAAGDASALRIDTWVPDEGPNAAAWLANFDGTVQTLTSRARERFIEVQGGHKVALAKAGAEHSLGVLTVRGGTVTLHALWWSKATSSIVSMSGVEATGSPIVASIGKIANRVVPMIH